MHEFLEKVSHGPEAELGELIYGYTPTSPGAKQVLLEMLRPLRAPSADQHMRIEASQDAGRFTILAVRVPWPQPPQRYGFPDGFQPIIICHEGGRDSLVGYLLPFNDIMPQFQGTEMSDIMRLSQWWIQTYGQR